MTAAKFSILFLCRRIFYHDRRFRMANTFVGLLCLLWYIAATLGVTFLCIPIRKNWTADVDGRCTKLQVLLLVFEVPNAAIDFVMIALPTRVVKDLRLSLFNKIALSITFILGGLYAQSSRLLALRLSLSWYICYSVGVFGLIRVGLLYRPDHCMYFSFPFLTI